MQRITIKSFGIYCLDRLHPIKIASLAGILAISLDVTGCKLEGSPDPSTRERVAVVAAQKPLKSGKEWCDIFHPKGKAPKLELPKAEAARAGEKISSPSSAKWIWLNLWATWCGPCLREMPLIEKWVNNLNHTGAAIDMWFLSVDEEKEVLSSFFQKHQDIAKTNSLRLADPEALPPWLSRYGLEPDTAIPINILVAPGMEVRCVRTGSISDSDFPIVRALIQGKTES